MSGCVEVGGSYRLSPEEFGQGSCCDGGGMCIWLVVGRWTCRTGLTNDGAVARRFGSRWSSSRAWEEVSGAVCGRRSAVRPRRAVAGEGTSAYRDRSPKEDGPLDSPVARLDLVGFDASELELDPRSRAIL